MFRAVIFDLFHTLTGPDLGLAEYPKTNEVLGTWSSCARCALGGCDSVSSRTSMHRTSAAGRRALAGCFDAELLSCEVGLVKPDPAIYAACLGQLGVAGRECLYVGDGAGNELVGARAAGCHTLLFTGMIEHVWPERIPARHNSAKATAV